MSTAPPPATTVDAPPEDTAPAADPPLTDRAPGAAWWTFVALVAVAAAVFAIKGRGQWFYQDEWVFLSRRDGHTVRGLFRAHNQHWVTLPVAAYRTLFSVFGLDSYKPYQALSISAHLATAVLLRVVIRRMGVAPWVATASVAAVLFYGTGSADVVWAFQVTFGAALAFGLAHLVLADHPAPGLPRVLGGAACGIAALMCSGVGLVMAGVVALAVLARHGWRRAAVTTAPLALAYLWWWWAFGRHYPSDERTGLGQIPSFVLRGVTHLVGTATQYLPVTVAVVAVSAVGIGLIVWGDRASLTRLRRDLGIPVALALGGVGFFVVVGSSRAGTYGAEYATRSRFAYVGMVLLTPLAALAFDAVIRRWRAAALPLVALLLVGIPGNIAAITVERNREIPPALVLAVAHSDALAAAGPNVTPFPDAAGFRTIRASWLRQEVASGRIPEGAEPSPDLAAEAIALLALQPAPRGTELGECRPLLGGERIELAKGEVLGYRGNVRVRVISEGGRSEPRRLSSRRPQGLVATQPLSLVVAPAPDPQLDEICPPA